MKVKRSAVKMLHFLIVRTGQTDRWFQRLGNGLKPFGILFPLSLRLDFSQFMSEQIEHQGCGIGISTKGLGQLKWNCQ